MTQQAVGLKQCDLSCEIFFSFSFNFVFHCFFPIYVPFPLPESNFSFNGYFRFIYIDLLSVKSTVCPILSLMFGNGMHAILFVHCKLLLHKELVLPYRVT